MKVCLGQVNTTPGDFSGNFERIRTGIARADEAGCDAIVFPELTIPGYLGQDLVYHHAYIDRNLEVLDAVRELTSSCHARLHVVVGYIDRNRGPGKPFFNKAAVLRAGEIVGKALLPTFNSGKVQPGQRANIRLDGYPYQEFGVLQGQVTNIALVPDQETYLLEIALPDSLVTTYHRSIPFAQELPGQARIVTEDRRILERVFDQLVSLVKNN